MQFAKDTFYIALRQRLASVNPSRIMSIRFVTRPALLVADAEAALVQLPEDTFVLNWSGLGTAGSAAVGLSTLTCNISYRTGGSQAKSGLDRGRALSEVDRELKMMLVPFNSPKMNYSTNPPTQMSTQVFWTEATFAPIVVAREQLERTATIQVFSFYEPGE